MMGSRPDPGNSIQSKNIRKIKPIPRPNYHISNIQPFGYPQYNPQRSILQEINFGKVRGKPVDPINKDPREFTNSPPSPRLVNSNSKVTQVKFPDNNPTAVPQRNQRALNQRKSLNPRPTAVPENIPKPNYAPYKLQRPILNDENFGRVRGKPTDPVNEDPRKFAGTPPSPRPRNYNQNVTQIKFPEDNETLVPRDSRLVNKQRRSSDPVRFVPEEVKKQRSAVRRSNSFQSLPDRRLKTGSGTGIDRHLEQKPDRPPEHKNMRPSYYEEQLPNIPMRNLKRNPNSFPPRPMIVEKSPEAVAIIPTNKARFTPEMDRVRHKTTTYAEDIPPKRNYNVGLYRDPNRLVKGARYPTGVCCGALNSSFLITIWGFVKILQVICCIILLVCALLENLLMPGITWVIVVAVLGIFISIGSIIFHLVRGHLKENRCVLATEFILYLFMSLCVLSAAIIATIQLDFSNTVICITIVAFIATLLFGVDTIITGSWIGARTYVPPNMRPRPVLYPPNYQPRVYYPRVKRDVIYDPPEILLDPWEKKIHYNDYQISRYNYNLNNPRDARLPDKVDVRYIQNRQPRYLKPLYRREYRFPEDRYEDYDDIRTAPVHNRYKPREAMDGFRSFPDREFRRYQSMVVKPIVDEDDLLRDDSRSHVTVFHHKQYNNYRRLGRPVPRLYHRPRDWRFPEYDDFTSNNDLDSNLTTRGSNDLSLHANYHKRRDYRLPNFKTYDDWRIQKHRARQLSTIPAKPKLRREHFWSVDSIPSDRHRRRDYPNFKTYDDWNIPRDRHSISTVPNLFPEKDDFQSTVGEFESKIGDNFSTTPFPDRSLVDTTSLIRPYRPKPRPDPDLQDKTSVNSRNDPAPGVPGDRSVRNDRISNRDSDNASIDANRSNNSQRMAPIFNKDKPPKTRKSVGSV